MFTDDHARVVMKDPDEEGCDYINASYLDVSASGRLCAGRADTSVVCICFRTDTNVYVFSTNVPASLQGYGVKNAYIATQGPVPETIEDFWQMVWEQKSPVIVMLTRVDEGGRVSSSS